MKDPKTGKKLKATEVARRFQPGMSRDGEPLSDKMYDHVMKNFKSQRKHARWYRTFGVYEKKDPGLAVRRIISRHIKTHS